MSKNSGICTRRYRLSVLCQVMGENASHEGTKTRRRHESEANRAERLARRVFLPRGLGENASHEDTKKA